METNNGTQPMLINENGWEQMNEMFGDSAAQARKESADAEKLLVLFDQARSVTLHVESGNGYGVTRVNLTYDQLAILTRALESRVLEEDARADRLEEAVVDCAEALAEIKKKKEESIHG